MVGLVGGMLATTAKQSTDIEDISSGVVWCLVYFYGGEKSGVRQWSEATRQALAWPGLSVVQVVSSDHTVPVVVSLSDGSLGTDSAGETGPLVGHLHGPGGHNTLAHLSSHSILADPPRSARQVRAGLGLLGAVDQV